MSTLTKEALTNILNKGMSLKEPEFQLRKVGKKWVGNVISPTFKGKRDRERLDMMWNALEKKLGDAAYLQVGFLLPYTPEEWEWGADVDAPAKKRKHVAAAN